MLRNFSLFFVTALLGSFSLAQAAQIDIKAYDDKCMESLPFTMEQLTQAHLGWMKLEYTPEDIEKRTPIVKKRIELQHAKLQQGMRHLILATDANQELVGISWVSNPIEDVIIINQSNGISPDITAKCSFTSLKLFPKAKTIQLAIMKQREQVIQLLQLSGWKKNEQPSPYLDDENVDPEQEIFFEIGIPEAYTAMGKMKQIMEQQAQLGVDKK